MELTQERLKELLDYSPETGLFYWKVSRGRATKGKLAGTADHEGYIKIVFCGKAYRCNRLAWFYMTGGWPPDFVDHKNLDVKDNSFANLRLATNSLNKANGKRPCTNTSGFKGVSWHKRAEKWMAGIMKDGHSFYLGSFATKEMAAAAYIAAAKKMFGEFARAL